MLRDLVKHVMKVLLSDRSQIHEPIDGLLAPPRPLVLMRFQSYYGFNSLPEPLASAGTRRDQVHEELAILKNPNTRNVADGYYGCSIAYSCLNTLNNDIFAVRHIQS